MFFTKLKTGKQETDIYTARRVGLTFDSQKLKVNIALPYSTVFWGSECKIWMFILLVNHLYGPHLH